MSTKQEKPTLLGHRLKTRKRDEKAKYDPLGFRDTIIVGLLKSGSDLDAVSKYLDAAGSKLDYRTYGETLFDILIAGGILIPGGGISEEGSDNGPIRTDLCIFCATDDALDTLRTYAVVFTRLMRRYKYLEKIFEEEMKKVLVYLKGFAENERIRLARCIAIWTTESIILDAKVLNTLIQDHLVKDGLAIEFLCEILLTTRNVKDVAVVRSLLRKAGLDSRLMDFLPANKRTDEYFSNFFKEKGLAEIIDIQKSLEKESSIKELQTYLNQQVRDNVSTKEIILGVQEIAKKQNISESKVITVIWAGIMSSVEWNKKEEIVAEQSLKHLHLYAPLLAAFTSSARSELTLLVKIQEFCYDNMNFMKVFQKIVFLLYKADVLSEEVILKWYKDSHSPKGKSVFLDQIKKFVEWLQNAEEEESDESDESDDDE